MKNMMKKTGLLALVVMMVMAMAAPAFAEENSGTVDSGAQVVLGAEEAEADEVEAVEDSSASETSSKAYSAAAVVGVVAAAGAIAMAIAISKAVQSISRQPEAGGQIRTSLMLGLVFIETAIIYALIVAILIIFVLN